MGGRDRGKLGNGGRDRVSQEQGGKTDRPG